MKISNTKTMRKRGMLISVAIIVGITQFKILNDDTQALDGIIFPLVNGARYSDDFTASRSNGQHNATDIFAEKGRPVVAAATGTITYVPFPEPSFGYMITIRDSDGYKYNYIHMNNDTPGTDDGLGGAMNAYAADMKNGNRVINGQLLGYVGDSGNAETTAPHLHFEIIDPSGKAVNPYSYLRAATIINEPYRYPQLDNETLPYGDFKGGLSIASGELDSGSTGREIVTGAGRGGGPHVRLFDQNRVYIERSFFAYDEAFRGGIDVAVGDTDGDGQGNIVTGPGPGGGPHIRVFDSNGQVLNEFFAYDKSFTGGVFVTTGDVDGDGDAEIITGTQEGGGPHVRVFDQTGLPQSEFFAFDQSFRGGVDVAAGDVVGDSKMEIVTGAGLYGGPHVRVWSLTQSVATESSNFFAYDTSFNGGVRVSVGDAVSGGKSEIVTVPSTKGQPYLRVFSASGNVQKQTSYLEPWWEGYQDVTVGGTKVYAGSGINRRATIRPVYN